MRRSVAAQKASALAACCAAEYSYSHTRGLGSAIYDALSHVDNLSDLKERLEVSTDIVATSVEWLKSKSTRWNSGATNVMGEHFLRELKEHDAFVYKAVVAQTYNVVFFENTDGVSYVDLYRSDTRSQAIIFSSGFQPKHCADGNSFLLDYYATDVTYTNGVSTSKNEAQTHCYVEPWSKRHTYAIRFNGEALKDPRFFAIDIVATGKLRGWGGGRTALAEVNFMDGIPASFIYSVTHKGITTRNPDFTGAFADDGSHLYKVVAPLAHDISNGDDHRSDGGAGASARASAGASAVVSDPAALASTATSVVAASVPATSYAPSVPVNVTIGRYSCTIQLYKGGKGYMHLVFDDIPTANDFIQKEDLRAERDPSGSTFKRPDTRRYSGKAMVRLSQSRYALLANKLTELPDDVTAVPTAPAYAP